MAAVVEESSSPLAESDENQGKTPEVQDDYGFFVPDDLACAYKRYKQEHVAADESCVQKWKDYIKRHGTEQGTLERTTELRNLVREGIPHELRPVRCPQITLVFAQQYNRISGCSSVEGKKNLWQIMAFINVYW